MLAERISDIEHALSVHFPKTYDIRTALASAWKMDVRDQFSRALSIQNRKFDDFTNLIPAAQHIWCKYNIHGMSVNVFVVCTPTDLRYTTTYFTIFEFENRIFTSIPNIVLLDICGKYINSSERVSTFQYPVNMFINEWNKPTNTLVKQDNGYYTLTSIM